MVKNLSANAGDTGLILGLGRSPREGSGNSLQYCLDNPMDRGTWQAIVQVVASASESEVAQSCPTLCDPMDCSPPGFSVHGVLQARILEWLPFPSPTQVL